MSKKDGQRCFTPDTNIEAGIGLLGIPEWQAIQGFSETCIFTNPSTRAMMEEAITFKPGDTWDTRFNGVVDDYAKLKSDCQLFETNVKKEMLEVAHDLCDYATLCKTVYTRLSTWMYDFPVGGVDNNNNFAKKFETLANGEWGKKAGISPDAEKLQGRFVKFLGQLEREAKTKKERVDKVSSNLEIFETSLKTRESAFNMHKTNFDASIKTYQDKLDVLDGKIKQLKIDIQREEKADYDKIMVLKTAPVYLVIPILGPFIMASILLSVGIATGVLRKQLDGIIAQSTELQSTMGKQVTQMAQTKTVAKLVTETLDDIKEVKPLIRNLSLGWGALASEVGAVVKYVSGSLTNAEKAEWDDSAMDLESATSQWGNVYKKADRLRQFSSIKCVKTIDEAILSAQESNREIVKQLAATA
jgi:hypothetical protein